MKTTMVNPDQLLLFDEIVARSQRQGSVVDIHDGHPPSWTRRPAELLHTPYYYPGDRVQKYDHCFGIWQSATVLGYGPWYCQHRWSTPTRLLYILWDCGIVGGYVATEIRRSSAPLPMLPPTPSRRCLRDAEKELSKAKNQDWSQLQWFREGL